MNITLRQIVRQLTETRREYAQIVEHVHRVALVAAVIDNPYPTGYVTGILDGLDAAADTSRRGHNVLRFLRDRRSDLHARITRRD